MKVWRVAEMLGARTGLSKTSFQSGEGPPHIDRDHVLPPSDGKVGVIKRFGGPGRGARGGVEHLVGQLVAPDDVSAASSLTLG